VPASALERLILPSRVADYSPAMLDELCTSGEVLWAGAGSLPGNDGWITLAFADTAPLLLPVPDADLTSTPLHDAILTALDGDQALFFRALAERVHGILAADATTPVPPVEDTELVTALWDLAWGGYLGNDTLAPVRALLSGGKGAHRGKAAPVRSRYRRPTRYARPTLPSRTGPPTAAGRWTRLPEREADPTRRAHALAEVLLERYGVLTRGAVMAEGTPGGFAGVYPVLSALEESGRARRGYFVDGLGGAQFAVPGAVDRLRSVAAELERQAEGRAAPPSPSAWLSPAPGGPRPSKASDAPRAVVLAATDPANPYGAALPWPERETGAEGTSGHRPGRKAGALVVLVDGALALYVERGGRTLLSWSDEEDTLQLAADALALAVAEGWLGTLSVERADGGGVHDSPLAQALTAAGFRVTPKGLRLRP
jgi:ATP-dependent helicase Lhr and Lhr-like helicase